ncbi:unnamed protein product [Victoria cruziana]
MARPRALGRSAGSFLVVLFYSRHEKVVRKRYAQCMEDQVSVVSLQLAPAGARPARPEWAPQSAPLPLHSFDMWWGLSLFFQPDLERYYESSIPDSLAAAIWFTGTTKNSLASVTDVSKISDHKTKTPVVLLVSIPKLILEAQAPSCSAIRTWSPYHGEGKIKL